MFERVFEIALGPLLSSKFFSHSELCWWLILLWNAFMYYVPILPKLLPILPSKSPKWASSFPFPGNYWLLFFSPNIFFSSDISWLSGSWFIKMVGGGLISLLSPSILINMPVCFCVSAFEVILSFCLVFSLSECPHCCSDDCLSWNIVWS